MAIFKTRSLTLQDIGLVFAACVFPIHIWSILNVLQELPAWLLRLSAWDLVGVIAYTQLFALMESLIILAILVFLGLVLPTRVLANRFVTHSSLFVFWAAFWAMSVQYYYEMIRLWSLRQFLPWLFIVPASIIVPILLTRRYPRFEAVLLSMVSRLGVLAFIYVSFDILSFVIVLLRNI